MLKKYLRKMQFVESYFQRLHMYLQTSKFCSKIGHASLKRPMSLAVLSYRSICKFSP